MLRLYIFRHFNTYMDEPTRLLKRFLHLKLLHEEEPTASNQVTAESKQMQKTKMASVRMSPTVTLRNVEMTSEQRRKYTGF